MQRNLKKWLFYGLLLGIVTSTSSIAFAEEDLSYPYITTEVSVEIQNDDTYDSDDKDAEQNELGTLTEPAITLQLNENLSFNAGLVLEAVEDPDPREDREFEDHGMFLEVLTINYDTENFGVYAGKFGPNFSIAFDAAAGLYGTDLSEDYIELAEFMGVGGWGNLGETAFGTITFSASLFTQDRTSLQKSAFKDREEAKLSDGGPGNSKNADSFSFALDGEEIPSWAGSRWHLGYVSLDNECDVDEEEKITCDDENRYTAGLEWSFETESGLTFTPLLEYVRIENHEGTDTVDRDFYTASLLAEYRNWNLALAGTSIETDLSEASDPSSDYQYQISAGYMFKTGTTIDIGVKKNRTSGDETYTRGILLAHTFEF